MMDEELRAGRARGVFYLTVFVCWAVAVVWMRVITAPAWIFWPVVLALPFTVLVFQWVFPEIEDVLILGMLIERAPMDARQLAEDLRLPRHAWRRLPRVLKRLESIGLVVTPGYFTDDASRPRRVYAATDAGRE